MRSSERRVKKDYNFVEIKTTSTKLNICEEFRKYVDSFLHEGYILLKDSKTKTKKIIKAGEKPCNLDMYLKYIPLKKLRAHAYEIDGKEKEKELKIKISVEETQNPDYKIGTMRSSTDSVKWYSYKMESVEIPKEVLEGVVMGITPILHKQKINQTN